MPLTKTTLLRSFVILALIVTAVLITKRWQRQTSHVRDVQSSFSPSVTTAQPKASESEETINRWQQKFIQQQTTIEPFFHNYNACLPRLIAPRQLKESDYPYDYLIEMSICTHDAMKKFANELDIINSGTNFIDALRFGTCDRCSESYYPYEAR